MSTLCRSSVMIDCGAVESIITLCHVDGVVGDGGQYNSAQRTASMRMEVTTKVDSRLRLSTTAVLGGHRSDPMEAHCDSPCEHRSEDDNVH